MTWALSTDSSSNSLKSRKRVSTKSEWAELDEASAPQSETPVADLNAASMSEAEAACPGATSPPLSVRWRSTWPPRSASGRCANQVGTLRMEAAMTPASEASGINA